METINNTSRLERLSQKEIIRFYTHFMYHIEQNPNSFKGKHYDITTVTVNDMDLMTKIQIHLKDLTGSRSFLYTDFHAINYSCSNITLEPAQ